MPPFQVLRLNEVRAGLVHTLQDAVEKSSNSKANAFFNGQMPLSSLLKDQELGQTLSDFLFHWNYAIINRLAHLKNYGTMQGKRDENCEQQVQSVISFAQKSSLAKDAVFMDYLAALTEEASESKKFNQHGAEDFAPALFGYAATAYLPIRKVAEMNDLAKEIIDSLDTSALISHVRALYGLETSLRDKGEQAKKNMDIVVKHRLKAQGEVYSFLDYLEKNYGLVFVPQKYADEREGKDWFAPEYQHHTEPTFKGLNCDDTVAYVFGIPFLPLAPDSRATFLYERDAIVSALEKISDALHSQRELIYKISYEDAAVAEYLRDDKKEGHPFHFDRQLESYSYLLLSVSRHQQNRSSRLTERDWSFPTFRFALPLKEAFETLLQTRRKELSLETIEQVELTLKILDVRRKMMECFWDSEKDENKRTIWRPEPHQWDSISGVICDKNPHIERHYPGVIAKHAVNISSMIMLGDFEMTKEYAKAFNEAGIEKIIGYNLPETSD